jgi:hypothetical protein
MIPLTANELTLIGYIEQRWHATGKFPRAEVLKEKFDTDIKALLADKETFRLALVNRGIKYPNYDLIDLQLDGLSNEQVAAIITMVNWDDKRPRATKLKEMGITVVKWNGWMKEAAFVAYLQDLSSRHFQDALDKAQEGLMRSVERGDTNAIKLYMELTGRYSPGSAGQGATADNVRVILQRVVEVIQRHVKDPEILKLIGLDFEKVMNGEKLEERKVIDARL